MKVDHALMNYEKDNGWLVALCRCGWTSPRSENAEEAGTAFRNHLYGLDAPPVVGRQSDIEARFDLIDPVAIRALARVLHEGAQVYGEGSENWKAIPVRDHLNHAVAHVYRSLEGDESEDHLPHALCRLMFAVSLAATVQP